jgi:PucR family transcriptional regulator, proline-responsive transcriptional activator
MLTLEKLLKRINKENLKISCDKKNSISYNMVNPIFKSSPVQDNTLYVGLASELDNIYFQNSNVGFILIPDIPLKKDINIACELVLLDEIVTFETLFNTVQREFRKEIDLASNISSILSALTKGNGLKELVEISTKLLGNPIIVTNSSYKIMAMSDFDIDDHHWRYAKTYGYCNQESINKYKSEGIAKKVIESENPILLTDAIAKNIHIILKKLVIENKIIGYIGVHIVNNEFVQSNFDAINLLADIISIEMKNEIYGEGFTNKAYESIIIDLLNNEIPIESILENRLKAANWHLKESFSLIKIPLSKSDHSIWFFDYFCSELTKRTTLCKFVKYHDSLVVIINYDTQDEYKQEIDNIKYILKSNKIEGGVSSVFTKLELRYLKFFYNQASKAREIGKLTNTSSEYIFFYEDIALFHFFSKIQNKNELRMFCHPAYKKLLEYDKINGTEYCKTLYEYILCANNVSASAKKLFIHRNTMSYRINKITEITGLDLTNGKNIYKLYMAIKINKWLNL